MLPRIIVALFTGASLPPFQQFFPPMPPAQQLQQTPFLMICVLMLSLAAAYLALWRAAPDFRAFRTLGTYFAFVALQQLILYAGGQVPYWSLRAITSGMLVATAGDAMQIPRRRWTMLFWPVYAFVCISAWFPYFAFAADWSMLSSEIPLAILIVQGLRRNSPRDRMIAAAFLFYWFVRLSVTSTFQHLTGIKPYATIGGWHWQYSTITLTMLGVATLAIFARDLIRDRREKERLAAELAAGRAVQQVLIPEVTPSIPGFNIQSAYKPFGEVGGDFFQIIATANGGVLVVIGDVSGKGLPAAMTVSLLVGTIRTLAHFTQSPGEILAAMNHRMLARSDGGFTTCLALRADADGALTIANAGHIAPYLDGRELPLHNGLPLGISAATTYPEAAFQLAPGRQLTLLTDGVVEARDKAGALFGFDRTLAASTEPSEEIARRAQHFGQEDDITVLSLALAD
jgi:hypothetical protein